MKKRLTKIFGGQLSGPSRAVLPTDRPLNVVLLSGDTLFGNLAGQTEEQIRIEDRRFNVHTIDINRIDVVIFDYQSSY